MNEKSRECEERVLWREKEEGKKERKKESKLWSAEEEEEKEKHLFAKVAFVRSFVVRFIQLLVRHLQRMTHSFQKEKEN